MNGAAGSSKHVWVNAEAWSGKTPNSLQTSTSPVLSPADKHILEIANAAQRKAVSASKMARENADRAANLFQQLQKAKSISLGLISASCRKRTMTRHFRKWQNICRRSSSERASFQARHRLRAETNRADDYAEQLMTVQAASAALIKKSRRQKVARLLESAL